MNSLSYISCYIPYVCFTVMIIAGLHYNNIYVVAIGIFFILFYDPQPEIEIISKQNIYSNSVINIYNKKDVKNETSSKL